MRISLLGPVEVIADDATPVALGGVRLRMLLARLALEGGRPVSVDALVDGLWGEHPPADAGNALQALVSRLRRALRGAGTVDSVAGGYRIAVATGAVDAHRFEELAGQGRRELAAGRTADALAVYERAAVRSCQVLSGPVRSSCQPGPAAPGCQVLSGPVRSCQVLVSAGTGGAVNCGSGPMAGRWRGQLCG
ncbi:winged helix-turn-helix domain-containing protein [Streptomyces sp. NPDC058268]|uniref:AfsR/SARP family transcriptional regulator n=1 Tax=Streptomyces sp. NPDC058268 TaxID=3346413 RepID=UPI0036E00C05